MPHPIAYLSFNGNCKEAMHFYEHVLQGKIELMMTGGASPMAAQMPPDFADKIIHARLVLPDGGLLYGGDCPPDMPHEGFKGFTLTLNYDSIEEAEKIFQLLAEGGHVIMPMGATFWAESFGMVADKFGCSWNINGKLLPM